MKMENKKVWVVTAFHPASQKTSVHGPANYAEAYASAKAMAKWLASGLRGRVRAIDTDTWEVKGQDETDDYIVHLTLTESLW